MRQFCRAGSLPGAHGITSPTGEKRLDTLPEGVLGMPIQKITSGELEKLISSGKRFVAVFSASWCGFCRGLIKDIERKGEGLGVVVVDISDESDPAWDAYRIEMVPTAVLFDGGREAARKPPGWDGLSFSEVKGLLGKA